MVYEFVCIQVSLNALQQRPLLTMDMNTLSYSQSSTKDYRFEQDNISTTCLWPDKVHQAFTISKQKYRGKMLQTVDFVINITQMQQPTEVQRQKGLRPVDFVIVIQEQFSPLKILNNIALQIDRAAQLEQRRKRQVQRAQAQELKKQRQKELDQVKNIRNIFANANISAIPNKDQFIEGERKKIKFF